MPKVNSNKENNNDDDENAIEQEIEDFRSKLEKEN